MSRHIYAYFLLLFIIFSAQADTNDTSNTTLSPIIVHVPKPSTPSSPIGPRVVLTRQQLNATGVTSLTQALSELGGVQIQDLAGNNSQVLLGLRGFGANASSNTLLLINGIPITNPDLAPPDLNAIPLKDIESIEIIAGSESVRYGDQAVGGIINIWTREKIKETADISCQAGSYNARECDVSLHHPSGRLNNNISVSTRQTDNYRDHNRYDQHHLFGNMTYTYPTGHLQLNYKIADERMQYPGALTAAQVRQNRQQANNDTDFFYDWNGFVHVNQKQQLNDHWQINTDVEHRAMNGHGVLSSPFTQSRTSNIIKPELKGLIHETLFLSGGDWQEDHYQLNSAFGDTLNRQQKYGLFSLATLPLYPRLSLSLGARGAQQQSHLQTFSDTDHLNRAFATTLGLTYQIASSLQTYLRRAGSFRFPKADENAFVAAGVTALRTQRGVSYETGLRWKNDTTRVQLGLYQLNLRDEIAFDPTQTPTQPFGSNKNLAPTVRRGLTASGKHQLTDRIALDGQYNFVNARFQSGINNGNHIPLVSEHMLRTGINYKINDHFNLYPEAVYTGNQYAANDDANIGGKIGGYTLYNINLRYVFKNFSASFHVNNIFNKYYYFYTVYQSSVPHESFYPAPGRNILLALSVVIR